MGLAGSAKLSRKSDAVISESGKSLFQTARLPAGMAYCVYGAGCTVSARASSFRGARL